MTIVQEKAGRPLAVAAETTASAREDYFSTLDWHILNRVSRFLLIRGLANIVIDNDSGRVLNTPFRMASSEGQLAHLTIRDQSAVRDPSNLETFFEICGLARQFVISARERRVSDREQEQRLLRFIEQQGVASFGLSKALEAFRNIPTSLTVSKLREALSSANLATTYELNSSLPLPLSSYSRVRRALKEYIDNNPFSTISPVIREEIFAFSDDRKLHREMLVDFILTPFAAERFSASDPTAELRAKDGLIKRIVISAHSGNGLAQKDLIEIYKGISEEGRFYQAVLASEAGSYRRVREGLAEMRDYIVGKIHDCVRKYDKATKQLVFDYFELTGQTSEERLFLLSTIASLDRGFDLEFYERLVDYCFGGDTEVNSHLRGYAKDRYQRGRLAQATSLNLAIFSMASDFEIAEKCPRYVSSFVADCIRSLFSTDGHVFQSAFTFILGLVNNSLVPADMASAACWRLTNNLGANLGQAEKKKVVLALLGSALTENEGRYPEILQRRNVADILLRLNGFIADQKIGQGFFSPDVVARWGREIQAYRLFRERNPIAGGSDSVWGELTRFKRILGLG